MVDAIDLEVRQGEVLGILDMNGAGKTTAVRILTGLLRDFEGEARVAGFDPREEAIEVKRRMGYVAENAVLHGALTVAEFLLLVGRLHELEEAVLVERARTFLEVLGIGDRAGSRISELSKGMRQKVLLTAALAHRPRILFADEPLSGLDVDSALLIKHFLRAFADGGGAVLYCSHVMDVVERICDHIVVLRRGEVIAEGSFGELAARASERSLEEIFSRLTSEGDQEQRAARLIEALQPEG